MLDKWLLWRKPKTQEIPLAKHLLDQPKKEPKTLPAWLKYCELKNIHGVDFPIPNPKTMDILSMEDLIEIQKEWLLLGQNLLSNNKNIAEMFEFLCVFNSKSVEENPFYYLVLNIKEIIHTVHQQIGSYPHLLYSRSDSPSNIRIITSVASVEVQIENKTVFALSNPSRSPQLSTFIPGQWIFELETLVNTLKNSPNTINARKLNDEKNTLAAITSTLNI